MTYICDVTTEKQHVDVYQYMSLKSFQCSQAVFYLFICVLTSLSTLFYGQRKPVHIDGQGSVLRTANHW